jgi:hypothetical protein
MQQQHQQNQAQLQAQTQQVLDNWAKDKDPAVFERVRRKEFFSGFFGLAIGKHPVKLIGQLFIKLG